jgi:sec-independent protein translocase protein TatC
MRLPRRLRYGEEATLVEHLDELRARLMVALGGLALAFIVAFVFHRRLIHWLELALPKERRHLVTFSVGEPFLTSVWVSVYAGLLLALPIILWQLWAFLMPAVEERHQRRILAFVVVASALLVAGVFFGYYVGLPKALQFLTNYDDQVFKVQIRARDYLSFATAMLLAFALVFELPIFVVALVSLGVLSSRTLRRQRRVGYFIVACIAVALPGVDPVTTTIETLPLALLFEGSIWLSVLLDRRSQRMRAAAIQT